MVSILYYMMIGEYVNHGVEVLDQSQGGEGFRNLQQSDLRLAFPQEKC